MGQTGLNPALWPDGARRDERGVLRLGGMPVTRLAEEYGTPLWTLDLDTVRSQARALREAFTGAFAPLGAAVHVNYASKALLTGGLLRLLVDEGYGVDVSTPGELSLALAAGVPASVMELHGNAKTAEELDVAARSGVALVIVDSADEIPRVAAASRRAGIRQRILLRLVTGVSAHTHEYLRTAGFDQKFGIPAPDLARAVEAVRRAEEDGDLELVGLHSHIGSQIFDSAGFEQAIDALFGFVAEIAPGRGLPLLNLGGGFGIAYTSSDSPRPIGEIADGFARAVSAAARSRGLPVPDIALEPGRYLVGRAGVTLYRVESVKRVPVDATGERARLYVSVDGGMSDNPRPELYGADYTAAIASRAPSGPVESVRVVGMHCETGDIVVQGCPLPSDMAEGDLIAVADTGAYTFSLSSNYNMAPRPAVVGLEGGRSRVLVRRETLNDLAGRDRDIDPGRIPAELAGHRDQRATNGLEEGC